MDTPKRLVEFFKLFTKPKEVIDVRQLSNRKQIRYITRMILLLEEEKKWYLEHDEDDLDYLYFLDHQINKLVIRRNDMYNIYLHNVVKYKMNPNITLKVS